MASTYSTNLGIELIGTGDQSGTWGATTNTNFGTLVEQAIVGYSTQAVTDSGTATVLTIANGASSTGRNYVVELTGALTADRTVTVPAVNKPYVFFNNTSGGFSVTVKVSGQTGVTIANGKKAIVYTNTTDVIEIANAPVTEAGTQTLTNKTLTSPVIGTVIGGTTASSTLTLKSTSGVGTTDSIAFKVGNNGATTAMTVTTAGNVGIGVTTAAAKLDVGGSIYSRPGNTAGAIAILTADATSGANGISLSAGFASGGYGPLNFLTSNSTSMTILANGNVGIGTTFPGYSLDVNGMIGSKGGALATRSSSATSGFVYNNIYDAAGNAAILCGSYSDTANAYRNDYHIFASVGAATEYMRISSAGDVIVGAIASLNSARLTIVNASGNGIVVRNSTATAGLYWNTSYVDSSNNLYIINPSSTGVVLYNGATAWTANSDERLKDIIAPITSALAGVQSLRAVRYSWKSDNAKVPHVGLIAQDVQKVLPEVVNSARLPQSADETEYLGVAYTEVIPLLVAAIQELSTKNDALEARLAKLETV